MSKKEIFGICHICSQETQLTFEHIPPKKAFNNRPIVTVTFDQAIKLGPDETIKGKTQQKGMGGHTLCQPCNNNTGTWYGKRFVDWCYHGFDILVRTNGNPNLIYFHHIFPLSVLKQIVTMFLSVNSNIFSINHPDLVKFVLNKNRKNLPPEYKFYIYYNIEGKHRIAGEIVQVKPSFGKTESKYIWMSEISYPPFGYLMTINSDPPDNRLFEITHFSTYDYYTSKTFPLQLAVLPTYLAMPGDYRSKKQILLDIKKNEEYIKNKNKK